MNRFRICLMLRLGGLVVSLTGLLLLILHRRMPLLALVVAGMIAFQVVGLFRYVERVNRELTRLFMSIGSDDFTQSFSFANLGPTFAELNRAFNRVLNQFLTLRSQKETQFRYLRTVVQHVGVGLISFRANGDIELINNAAKQILGVPRLRNIKDLESLSRNLVRTLFLLKPGENRSIEIESGSRTSFLFMHATQFKMHGDDFSLVSIQDIRGEIDRERMTKELEIAWGIQKSMLPSANPRIAGYDIAGACVPAEEVGGDYYDFIPLSGDRLAILVADVSGKGIPAAFYMTLVKGFVTPLMAEVTSLKQVLIRLNNLLYDTLKRKSFVTMFLAVLDPGSGTVRCVRAGHLSAVHRVAAGGQFRSIKPSGVALGILAGEEFSSGVEEETLSLNPGDWFILVTDGFVEAQDERLREYGERRLLEQIDGHAEAGADRLVDSLYSGVADFVSGGRTVDGPREERHDDMTVIALKRSPEGAARPTRTRGAGP